MKNRLDAETITHCIPFKCKTCPKRLECDKKLLESYVEPLTYKPFEKLGDLFGDDTRESDN